MLSIRNYLIGGAVIALMAFYIWGLHNKLSLTSNNYKAEVAKNKDLESAITRERKYKIEAEQLNAKNIEDLRNAKTQIDTMRASVESGSSELRIDAQCPESAIMPKASSSSSQSNATSPRLSDTAQRNYFLLQERHAEAISQIKGLQQHIIKFCSP